MKPELPITARMLRCALYPIVFAISWLRSWLFIAAMLALLSCVTQAQQTNRTPLNRAFLQSDLDGNGKAITNVSGVAIASPTAAILYVRTNGNNATAVRGTNAFPSLTISNAARLMLAGDTLDIGPGVFLGDKIGVPANSLVVGAGRSLTVVTGSVTAQNFCFQMTNNVTFRDLSVRMTLGSGLGATFVYPFYSASAGTTNVTFERVTAFGDSDVIVSQPSSRSSFTLRDCDLGGYYDTIAIKCTGDGTNSTLFASGCTFHAKGDIEGVYGFNIGNGVTQTASSFNFSDINHCAILSGFNFTTNGFVQGTNLWSQIPPVNFVGCQFISEDSKINVCLDLGAVDDPVTPLPCVAYVSGCTFITRYRTNLVNDLIAQSGYPTPVTWDVYLSKGSTLYNVANPFTIQNFGGTNFFVNQVLGTFTGDGSALTNTSASVLAIGTLPVGRMPALTGDVTSSAGSAATALKNTGSVGTYRSVTTDAQGRVTAGTSPTTFAGYAISDSSANLAAALTDETGTGPAVFGTGPTLTTPTINGGTFAGNGQGITNVIRTPKIRHSGLFWATGSGAPPAVGDTIGAEGNSTANNAPTATVGATRDSVSLASTSGIFGDHGNNNYRTGRNISFTTSALLTSTAQERVYIGMTDAATLTAQVASDTVAGNFALFRYSTTATDTKWQCIVMDGSTSVTNNSNVTVDTNVHLFEIFFNDSIPNVVFRIDGVTVATMTTHLPSASTNLRWIAGGTTLENVAKTIRWEFVNPESDR